MKRVAKVAVGWFFLVLGVIGCFLPILQGFLFMAVGLFFLAEESPFIKKYIDRLERKYPEQTQKVHEFRNAVKHKLRKLIHHKKKGES
jgi:uncharacterized membrane protein YbaN (DUF454 family)